MTALALLSVLLPVAVQPSAEARALRQRVALQPAVLELPGPPVAIIPADLDADGTSDLVVAVAYTEWDRMTFDHVEDGMQIVDVVPVLFDRREAWAFLGQGNGRFRLAGPPLPLGDAVISVLAGPAVAPVVALTDTGLSRVRLSVAAPAGASSISVGAANDGAARPALMLEPLLERVPLLAATSSFLPDLSLVMDVDADGRSDVLFPGWSGLTVYRSDDEKLTEMQTLTKTPHATAGADGASSWLVQPLPELTSIDGDAFPDLYFGPQSEDGSTSLVLMRGIGGGRFTDVQSIVIDEQLKSGRLADEKVRESYRRPSVHFLGDMDGDRRAELVIVAQSKPPGDAKMMTEFRHGKDPGQLFQLFRLSKDLVVAAEPYLELEAHGYPTGGTGLGLTADRFVDLDGDSRRDLVTVSFELSLMQAVRVVATKSVNIGLEFHVFPQREDGTFDEVRGQDLTERLKFDLSNIELGTMAQFSGDFDGDGIVDFAHIGRGREVTIHRGRRGGSYPKKPDLVLKLDEPIASPSYVRVSDFDADGLADLAIVDPSDGAPSDTTLPVRLLLYSSGGGR